MKANTSALGLLLVTLTAPIGCGKAPEAPQAPLPDPAAVVARYAGGEIRRAEIRQVVERRLASATPPVTPEARQMVVRKVIERRVRIATLRAAMKASGFEEGAEARFASMAAEERVLAADRVAAEVATAKAPDALVATAVEVRLETLDPAEARKFSHIFLRAPQTDESARAKAHATMGEILAALESGTGFNALAERHSQSVMARGGGRIEWTLRKDLNPAVSAVIFGLREGAVSPVVETGDGLHLFRLDGIRSGSPIDVEQVRRSVRRELDEESATLAERALRQRELDSAGVEFVSTARLERLAEMADVWVARWRGGEIRAPELRAVAAHPGFGGAPAAAVLRELVENRLLAGRRREAPLTKELESQTEDARDEAALESYRAFLVAGIDTEPTPEELAQFYRENSQGALFLRDYHVDLLFFPQVGDQVAEAYGAGEAVVARLRDGTSFDALLDQPPAPGARVCRDAHPVEIEELGRSFLRLRKAVLNLEVGGISPALYFDGPRSVVAAGKCELEGRGLAFARLREIGTLPFESVQAAIRARVIEQKRTAGITAIQERLVADARIEILLPEG